MIALICLLLYNGNLPPYCEKGLNYIRYNSEDFRDIKEQKIISDVSLPYFKQFYESLNVSGSFCPNVTGNYQIRLIGRATAQLKFIDSKYELKYYPKSLGPVLTCLPSIKTDETTETIYLYNTRCYSLEILLRTGCNLYSQYLFLNSSFEGSGFGSFDNFATCKWDNCYQGLYGQKCENKCTVDCHEQEGHGRCDDGLDGTGKCICNDGYILPNCEPAPPPVPPGCNQYVLKTVYNEPTNFSGVNETYQITNLTDIDVTNVNKSIIIRGSLLFPESGYFKLRINYSPEAQLIFNNKWYPETRESSGIANSTTFQESDVFIAHKNMTYPFLIKYVSGHENIKRSLGIVWKNGPKYHNNVTKAPWEPISDLYYYSCDDEECEADKYGEQCDNVCPKCPTHSSCFGGKNGNGTCICDIGYNGYDCRYACEKNEDCLNGGICDNGKCYCEDNLYGDHCEKYCDSNTCSNHGKCSINGECVCDRRYSGKYCEHRAGRHLIDDFYEGVVATLYNDELVFETVVDHPMVLDTISIDFKNLSYDSARITGSILVNETKEYRFKLFAQPSAQFSILNTTIPFALGYGSICDGSFVEEITDPINLSAHTYYPFTISYRSGCPQYPQMINLSWNAFGTDNYTLIPSSNLNTRQELKCQELYSGEYCDNFCELSCSNHGTCMQDKNMYCKCQADYYGPNCEFYCRSNTTCKGIGVCGPNGECVCPAGYSGVDCSFSSFYYPLFGNSLSCSKRLSYSWYADEVLGPIESTQIAYDGYISIDQWIAYKMLTLSGSFTPKITGLYRFKAVGKPTIRFSIHGVNVTNPKFELNKCDNEVSEAESGAILLNTSQLIPFSIQYRSGCSEYSKYIKLLYQIADQSGSFSNSTWELLDTEQIRDCNSFQCEKGFYGSDCSNMCLDCGQHGQCIDGVTGSGKCKCSEWYIGGLCTFDYFPLAASFSGLLLLIAIIWIFWPIKIKENHTSEPSTPAGFMSSEPMIMTANIISSQSDPMKYS